jgi:hypothetical protein
MQGPVPAPMIMCSVRYEFKRFKDQILSAEDPGFVRLKTASSRYVLPVQIHRFDHAMINRVRASAGLEPIHLDDAPEEPARHCEDTSLTLPDVRCSGVILMNARRERVESIAV